VTIIIGNEKNATINLWGGNGIGTGGIGGIVDQICCGIGGSISITVALVVALSMVP